MEIRFKIKGEYSIDVATTLNNIGMVYKVKGNYTKALENYNQCLEIRTKIQADSIDVATTLCNIGNVYHGKGDYTKALENYNQCL